MKIIYNKKTKEIYSAISKDQDRNIYYIHFDEEFRNNLDEIIVEKIPGNLSDYIVENNKLKRYSDIEIEEKNKYGRILTEDERILESMKLSMEEIKKAENTIEFLDILEGVLE